MIFIIYILIFFILIYVLYLGLKAASFGIKAKKDKKKFYSKKSLASELKKLEELYRNKSITKKELQIAKNKILKN
tara:strand:- start:115 stop:339 length:225 start_codon:yes stop_codon:yes gene_type:complete